MCGRFTLRTDPETLQKELGLLLEASSELKPRFNIAPSQNVVVVPNDGQRKATAFKWGLIPAWAKDPAIGNKMINARAESLHEKASYKGILKYRRCIILADGFFEWKKTGKKKTPVFIHRKDGKPFAFAGLWDVWKPAQGDPVKSCTIITTSPNAFMSELHDRMPVILSPEAIDQWLSPGAKDVDQLRALLRPFEGELDAYPVSPLVNSPGNESPDCVVRAELIAGELPSAQQLLFELHQPHERS